MQGVQVTGACGVVAILYSRGDRAQTCGGDGSRVDQVNIIKFISAMGKVSVA